MKKSKSYNAVYQETWKLHSAYVCLRDKVCVTCGSDKTPQAGHFVHGKCMDFVEKNIHRQCSRCNFYLQGNLINYSDFIISKYGIQTFKKLKDMKSARVGKLPTEKELLALQASYKRKINKLNKESKHE